MNRAERRSAQRYLKQESKKQPSLLTQVPREEWPNHPSSLIRVWRNREFLVQEFHVDVPAVARLSICRSRLSGDRWTDGISWDELQRLKREAGYGDCDAIEIFPSDVDIVNVANMRHLWVVPREILPFAWRKK